MPLIRRRRISLSLEDVSQMSPAVRAYNLRALHAERAIRVPRHCTWDGIEISGPSTAGLEFVCRFVERGGAILPNRHRC